jgi:hypothetical protein
MAGGHLGETGYGDVLVIVMKPIVASQNEMEGQLGAWEPLNFQKMELRGVELNTCFRLS